MNKHLIKSREISINEFFTRLQLEFLSYRVRSLIYRREEDKKKFNDICVKKKEKIEWIATKNCLPTIFNNENSQDKYSKRFFKEWGLPNFQYRDDYQLQTKGWWDNIYYFKQHANVKMQNGNDIILGEIEFFDAHTNLVTVRHNSGTVIVNSSTVCRIFNEDFFKKLFE